MTQPVATPTAPPRRKPRVHRELVVSLAQRILGGELAPGTTLVEAELCEHYGVSRTVTREAFKVLESKGLLKTRMRIGTQVQPESEWNMLDPDLLTWAEGRLFSPEFVNSLMEARGILEPAAAEMAARNATAQDLATLEDAYLRMCDSLGRDEAAWCDADLAFHTALLAASHNHVFMHLAGAIRAALHVLFELTLHHGSAHDVALQQHGQIVEAIRMRDPVAARAASESLLNRTSNDLGAARGAQP